MLVFFFFKQKTAYEMLISDWSSDVCSSDLGVRHGYSHMPQRLRPGPADVVLDMPPACVNQSAPSGGSENTIDQSRGARSVAPECPGVKGGRYDPADTYESHQQWYRTHDLHKP